ncbi:MAG: hypothetical protein N2746_09360 [Deltaproteobacteria bacterium]|nr:hypothetical protein [Deltaproteobacteria bacterium]
MRRVTFLLPFVFCFYSIVYSDTANFEFYGKIYNKWLYRNNDSQGVLTLGNPFWPKEGISGDNGVGSEFELNIKGHVSQYVLATVRLESRFGSVWQDWWESGDIKYDKPNTSGESLGMNRAEYIKLRGYNIRLAPPIPFVTAVSVGSSDFSMFNPYTIGKSRYIDRDNGKGIFVEGANKGRDIEYVLGIIALPKLYVGPGWSTGIGDPILTNPFYTNDYAYAAKLKYNISDRLNLTSIVSFVNDLEANLLDPDAKGAKYPDCKDELGNPIANCEKDNAVALDYRYRNLNATFEMEYDVTDKISINFIVGYSLSAINTKYATNGVRESQGMFPMIYSSDPVSDAIEKLLVEFVPLEEINYQLKLEIFNFGENWTATFGTRREADVLVTDGFMEGGQLPTLNLANEFIDFDEPFYESCIGWRGVTLLNNLNTGDFSFSLEYTFLTYNTNRQNRDIDNTYPNFTYSEGYTDTDFYDYSNTLDRGRDPRSVYKRNQDRHTNLFVFTTKYFPSFVSGLGLSIKAKFIMDTDYRKVGKKEDDYVGNILTLRFATEYQFNDEFKATLGYQYDTWDEKNRSSDPTESIYYNYLTVKHKPFVMLSYVFGGASIRYYLEYLNKDQNRGEQSPSENIFKVVRSKATMEVVW